MYVSDKKRIPYMYKIKKECQLMRREYIYTHILIVVYLYKRKKNTIYVLGRKTLEKRIPYMY